MRLVVLLGILICSVPALAADYWPDDATRTYVFGTEPDEIRLVIDPQGAGLTNFRYVGEGCDISWVATLSSDGTMEVASGIFFCEGLIEPPLDATFPAGSLLFDPTEIGGPIQVLQAEADPTDFVLSVRLNPVETITFEQESIDVVPLEFGIEDPLLLAPLAIIFVSVDLGPVAVNGLERTEVLDGIVREAQSTWGALKARF